MRKRAAHVVAAVAAAIFALAVRAEETSVPKTTYLHEAKITVNERAGADGFLRVRIRPENGQAREATIAVEKHMSENHIAKSIAEALGKAVGTDYKIDRDAGEHVKIKKASRAAPDFAVEITFSAPGFSIVLDD
ncbi:MAG TPA: hypothetical protein VFV10_08005 [Gammaproteobacteria bacterium]|nr:hypothetical protein [Gammaproteobacteria bacterium]